MKFHWFAEVTYPHLPADFRERYPSAWVTPPAHLGDPKKVGEIRRHREQFELMHAESALPVRRAEAVRAGVAAAQDDDALPVRAELEFRIERVAEVALVLLRQKFHREVDALEVASGDRQVARLGRAHGQADRVELFAHLVAVHVEAHAAIGDELDA